jgi:hypothetical protein
MSPPVSPAPRWGLGFGVRWGLEVGIWDFLPGSPAKISAVGLGQPSRRPAALAAKTRKHKDPRRSPSRAFVLLRGLAPWTSAGPRVHDRSRAGAGGPTRLPRAGNAGAMGAVEPPRAIRSSTPPVGAEPAPEGVKGRKGEREKGRGGPALSPSPLLSSPLRAPLLTLPGRPMAVRTARGRSRRQERTGTSARRGR